jgi:hypothetical protein
MAKKLEPSNSQEMFITRVVVENFPSRVELFQKLDNFVKENKLPRDFSTDNKDSIVYFIFKNPDTAFEFVKFLNMEKLTNPLYAKLKTNIVVDAKKEFANKKKKPAASNLNINTNLVNSASVSVIPQTQKNSNSNYIKNKLSTIEKASPKAKAVNLSNINNIKPNLSSSKEAENFVESYDYSLNMPRVSFC